MASARRALFLTAALLAPAAVPAPAQAPPVWGWSFSLGGSHWQGLEPPPPRAGQLDTVTRDRFSARGANLECSGFREHALAARLRLQVGGSFGVLWHEGDTGTVYRELSTGRTVESRAALNAGHLTGSVALLRQGATVSAFAGAGAGLYMLVFKETFGGWTVETSARSHAPGGYLQAGLELHRPDRAVALRLDAVVHFVSIRGAALQGGRVEGPVRTLRLGIVLREPR